MQPTSTASQVLQLTRRVLAEALGVAFLLFYAYFIVSPIVEGNWDRVAGLTFAVAGNVAAAYIWRRLVKRYDGAMWVPVHLYLLPVGIFALGLLAAFSDLDLPFLPDVEATVLSAEHETINSGDTLLRVELKLEAVRGAHRVKSIWIYANLRGNDGERYEALRIWPNPAKPSPCAGPGDFELSVRAPIVCRITFGVPKRLTSGFIGFDNGFVSDRTPTFSF